LIDVQWRTDHLATLGVNEISRSRYLERLRTVLPSPEPRMFSDTPRTISHPLT
jgi:leucyl/phenylalanyl-tRNA--protein transferase